MLLKTQRSKRLRQTTLHLEMSSMKNSHGHDDVNNTCDGSEVQARQTGNTPANMDSPRIRVLDEDDYGAVSQVRAMSNSDRPQHERRSSCKHLILHPR
jgi:hypothetical protein